MTRGGPDYGASGKVVAARNGYLIVQLGPKKTSYFRARDLKRGAGERRLAPPAAAGAGAPQRACACGAPPRSRKLDSQRITWRGQTMLDEEDEPAVAPHEHNYVRAIKQSPTMMGSVVERVEHLLALYPPERCVPPSELTSFRSLNFSTQTPISPICHTPFSPYSRI